MATHDYVLDNATGANFRSDLNNALAAIVSNNSSSSEPSTKYAYQWWADTNDGVLKIRNSSNDGWVTLLQLDGTLTLEDGSNTAPALGFRDDLNTGIFSSAADTLDITCGGTTRGSFSSSGLTVTGNVTATTFVGNIDAVDGDFDGTLEADAITVAGVALATVIAGTTVTTATNANHISVADNESTNENNLIPFIEDASATGNVGLESDGDFTYNPSTGTVTATKFVGDGSGLTGVGGTTINSNADNRVITGSGTANTLNAESILNFDSTGQLLIGHSGSSKTAGLLAQVNIETTASAALTVKRNSADQFGPFIGLGKTRATSIGGSTIVQANDRLGSIAWFASDGNNTDSDAAVIRAEVDGTPGSDDMPGRLLFLTTPDGANGSSERMRITNKGDVFIGRTSGIDTSEIFGIKGHSGDHCTFGMTINGTTNSSIIGFNDDDANFVGRIQYNHNGDEMGFRVASGNDAYQIRSDSKSFFNVVNSNVAIDKNNTGTIIDFIKGGSTVGTISISSSSTSYNTSSDYRLKENIVALTDGITRLKTLKPYRFNFISDKDTTLDGFLAHEVTAVPEAITGTKDEVETVYYESNDTIPEGKAIGDVKDTASPVYQGIDQSKLVPLLVAAVQELISKVETLEAA